MKTFKLLCLVVTCVCTAKCCLADPAVDTPITVRVASYNVVFGSMTTPEQLGEMFKPYNLDIIGFSEVPDGDWTARVGKVLGMKHSYVGTISSANHKDKYKSILSRTPLDGTTEHELRVNRRGFWNPASYEPQQKSKAFLLHFTRCISLVRADAKVMARLTNLQPRSCQKRRRNA